MVFIQALHKDTSEDIVLESKNGKLGNMDIEILKATMLESESYKLYYA